MLRWLRRGLAPPLNRGPTKNAGKHRRQSFGEHPIRFSFVNRGFTMTKSELRRSYLAKRRAIPPAEAAEKSRRITSRFFSDVSLIDIGVLHCFLSIEKFNEVDTSGIISRVWSTFPDTRIAVPKVDRLTGDVESIIFTPETPLAQSNWGIREPIDGMLIEADEIGMVLVPGLVFDLTGHRVGYGKGFYDRFLAKCRPECVKIGLGLFPPVDQIGDIHSGDVRLNMCITPDEIVRFDARSRFLA